MEVVIASIGFVCTLFVSCLTIHYGIMANRAEKKYKKLLDSRYNNPNIQEIVLTLWHSGYEARRKSLFDHYTSLDDTFGWKYKAPDDDEWRSLFDTYDRYKLLRDSKRLNVPAPPSPERISPSSEIHIEQVGTKEPTLTVDGKPYELGSWMRESEPDDPVTAALRKANMELDVQFQREKHSLLPGE